MSDGIAALEHVRERAPGLTPRLTLAKLYLAAERPGEARELLARVVRGSSANEAAQARALLEEMPDALREPPPESESAD